MNAIRKAMFAAMVALGSVAVAAPPAAPRNPPIDCTNGCYLITCGFDSDCTLWHCQGDTSCQTLSRFIQPKSAGLIAGGDGAHEAPPSTVYFKTCPEKLQCDLYELSNKGATALGSFDNIDGVVDDFRALREALRGQHAED